MSAKEVRIEIYGRVQGVGFRRNVRRIANSLDLKGSVLNLADGGILVVAQGEEVGIKEMISRLEKGPGFSKVDGMDVSWNSVGSVCKDFKIRRESNFFVDQFKSFMNLFGRVFF